MKSISRKAGQRGDWILYPVGILFLFAGSAALIFFTVLPLTRWSASQGWETVPCTVERSEVQTHRSSDGTTYRIHIEYTYQWDGRAYRTGRYNFFDASSSGYRGKEAVVADFPAGATRPCFVDPENPEDAVLNREFSLTYLIGLFGLIFIVIGASILIYKLRRRGNKSISASGEIQKAVPAAVVAGDHETITLNADRGGLFLFLFVLGFAVLWNSLMAGMFWNMFGKQGGDDIELGPILFLIPFLLVGLAMAIGAGYLLLVMFNPRPEVTLSPGYLPLGGSAMLGWRFEGDSRRIEHLTITLQGEERATYRRGTSTTTDTSVFHRVVLADTEVRGEIAFGEVPVEIPEFSAPSFDASNNKIVWAIKVHGTIRWWPDARNEFPVQVSPLPQKDAPPRVVAEFVERIGGEHESHA